MPCIKTQLDTESDIRSQVTQIYENKITEMTLEYELQLQELKDAFDIEKAKLQRRNTITETQLQELNQRLTSRPDNLDTSGDDVATIAKIKENAKIISDFQKKKKAKALEDKYSRLSRGGSTRKLKKAPVSEKKDEN